MKISVIIPTRNRASSLQKSLEALSLQKNAPEFEVIVVDNGSTDTTSEVIASPPSGLRVLGVREPQPNRALARNRGIALAQGILLVFIDDDVLVPQHFLQAHVEAHAAHPRSVISGPILNVATFENRSKPTLFHHSNAFFCTCNVSVACEDVRAVGNFDDGFSSYGWEDTELGVRLRRHGLRRYFAWQAYVYHLKPPGWETFESAIRRMQEKGQMARRFVEKSGDLRVRLATGDHLLNHVRGIVMGADWTMPIAYRLAEAKEMPTFLRSMARSHYLDGVYRAALRGRKGFPASHGS